MDENSAQCEMCPWPLECSTGQRAAKPSNADCPREPGLWGRRLGEAYPLTAGGPAPEPVAEEEMEEPALV